MASQPLQSTSANQPQIKVRELTIDDLAYLQNVLYNVAYKCFDFGLQLKVEHSTIHSIQQNYGDVKDQLREILAHRLIQQPPLMWHDIVQALQYVGIQMASQSLKSITTSQPQTQGKALTIHDLVDLHTTLKDTASKCFNFGLQLGVKYFDICNIKQNHRHVEDQLYEILAYRLNQLPPLTWCDIVQALRSNTIQMNGLASEIESQDMCQPSVTASQQVTSTQMTFASPFTHHSVFPTTLQPKLSMPNIQPAPQIQVRVDNSSSQPPQPLHPQPHPPQNLSPRPPPDPPTSTPSQPQAEAAQPPSSFQPSSSQLRSAPVTSQAMPGPSPQLSQDVATPHPLQVGEQQALQGQPPLQHIPSHQPQTVAQSHDTGSDSGHSWAHYQLPVAQSHETSNGRGFPQASRKHISPMTQYAEYVKTLYHKSEVEKKRSAIKWPLTPSTVYINLVCVDRTTHVSKEEADECTRAMICDGSVDVVLKKKTPIDFSDIARNVSDSETLILVEGAPGVGKSTFSWEFCRRWERGEIAQQYQLVLLLRLRDERISKAQNLADLIYHSSDHLHQAVVQELESTQGMNTLIILEGFDELPSTCRTQSSVFMLLIQGELLPDATLLVTSRPWATQIIHDECSHRILQHIEILGFTSDQIEEYVKSVFMGKKGTTNDRAQENIEEVMSYIKTYPHIKASMYIPLNSAIVVSVYQESKAGKCIMPRTMTELYYALIQTLLLRYLYGHPEYGKRRWKIQSLKEDLPPDVYSKLLAISELAYSGICTDQENSVQLIFNNLPPDFETLGLMQSVPQLYVTQGEDMSYNFLHLTVQEFLAALHISNLSLEKQLEHFKRQKEEECKEEEEEEEEGRWKVVLRFLSGITKLANLSPDLLRGLLLKNCTENFSKTDKRSPSPLSLSLEKPDTDQITEWEASMFVGEQDPEPEKMPKKWNRFNLTADVKLIIQQVHWMFETQKDDIVHLVLQERTVEFMCGWDLTPLDYYCLGYCMCHSHSHWVLTGYGVIGVEEVEMLVAGFNTRQDTSAKVVGLRDRMDLHESDDYCPRTISAEAINVLFVGLKNVLHLQELHLNLPAECSSIHWPSLSGVRVLHLGMKDGRNWRLDTLLPHLSIELLIITVSSCEGGLGSDNVASIQGLFSSSNCPKYVDITVAQKVYRRLLSLKEKKPVEHIRCPLDWYSVGQVIAHSNFQWMLRVEEDIGRKKVTGEGKEVSRLSEAIMGDEEVRKLVDGLNTRQDTSAKVVGLRGHVMKSESGGYPNDCIDIKLVSASGHLMMGLHKIGGYRKNTADIMIGLRGISKVKNFYFKSGGYCPLSITAEALNVLFVELKNVLHLQELHLNLPIQCSDIRWPNLSGLRELCIGISGERNWRLGTLLCIPHLSLESFTIQPTSDDVTVTLEDCEAIGKFLSSSDCLKSLQFNTKCNPFLSGFDINTEGMESITKALSENKSLPLKYFGMECECTFSDTAAYHLALFITNSATLNHLSIEWCQFSVRGLLQVVQAIHPISDLQDRKLEYLTCTVDGDEEATQLPVDLMACLSELTASLVTDRGATAIATALSHNSTLNILDLYSSSIGDAGSAELAQALHHNSTLKWLGLSNTSLSDTGLAALAEALHHNSTLKHLDLSGNDAITAAGMHHLVQALTVNTSIHHNSTLVGLDLSNNGIGDAGSAALAQALHHNSTLRGLKLPNNSIGDAGSAALAQALHHISTLEKLDLSGNDAIGEDGTCQLVQALTVNRSTTHLLLPRRCEMFATQCPQYSEVKHRIRFC